MSNDATGVIWRRLKYMLSPQLDIYRHISKRVSGLDIWEVGFGTGFGTVLLSSSADSVYATEIDEAAVSFAKQVFPLRNITWITGDVTHGHITVSHDAIVCLEVLEHIPDWVSAISVMRDHLRQSGTLYISGPNANANLRKNDKHEREWTAQEFKDALGQYFTQVSLMDYTLTEPQGDDTHLTPLVAICTNAKTE